MGALDYLPALSLGQKASEITGVANDAFVGMGYASLIQSLTGETPTIMNLGNRKARIMLTTKQSAIMQKWLEARVAAGIKLSKSPTNLDLNAGTFVTPVVMKYVIPVVLAAFVSGWIASSILGRK